MAVSVETLKGLERKITISVPNEEFEKEVDSRLERLAKKVKIDGFRPGKTPLKVVKQRYAESVCHEVARDKIESTLYAAMQENKLLPAGTPAIEPFDLPAGTDFTYSAIFEVYPEFEIHELENEPVKIVSSEISAADVDKMIENLRNQNKEWTEVTRQVAKEDKVIINFEGFVKDEPFEGGKGDDFEVIVGSGSMIPGFEDGLIGAQIDKEFELKVTFPADYGHEALAGQDALFKVTIKKIFEGKLPEMDDVFLEKFNIKEGGVEALKRDIQENMTRELDRRVSGINRETIFNALLAKNSFELPQSLVTQEIAHLQHEMYHRIFGHEHSEDEKIPDFPRELFEDQAKRRVHLGLLFADYVKKHGITVDKTRVDAMIEKFASAYEHPEEVRTWYRGNKERLQEVEALVMEELVADKIISTAQIVPEVLNYEEVIQQTREGNQGGV